MLQLPNITDSDVIGAFLAGTTYRDLVSKLGHKTPTRASELMDIATKFASGQEAVEAIFRKNKQPQGRQPEDVPKASAQHGARKKDKKKSQAKRDAADADILAAAEHRNPRQPPGGANLFDKMLKGVLNGTLMIGARLLEHLVEEVGTSGGFPRVLVLSGGDKVRVGGVAFRLRLLLALLLGAALS